MTDREPGTTGTITAGPSKGHHGTVIEPLGYWVRRDDGGVVGPFFKETSFKPDALWRSDFATGGFSEWTYEGTVAQPSMWPQSPPITVSGGMARFEVSAADAAAGRIHAKFCRLGRRCRCARLFRPVLASMGPTLGLECRRWRLFYDRRT